jgi:hypothetical protein
MKIETRNWVVAFFLVLLALAAAVVIPRVVSDGIPEVARKDPSVVLTLLVIAGVIGLLGVLAIVALAFAVINLSDRNQALGLPQGTVRSVIALSLILIFVIAAMYLYASLTRNGLGEVRTSTGLSEEMVEAWLSQVDDIVSIDVREEAGETVYDVERKVGDKTESSTLSQDELGALLLDESVVSITPRKEAGEKVYDVQREVGQSEASEDFASQLLTTVSTLVVAVAGFYFGTRAVAVARGEAVPSLPVIRSIDPDNGEQREEPYDITISGKNFESPKEIKLVRGSEEMKGDNITWSATEIRCKIVIDKKPDGKWDLIVVNEDGGEDRLPEAFTVTG